MGEFEMANRTIAMLGLRVALLVPGLEYSAAAQSIPKVLGNEKNTPREVASSLDHLLSYLPLKTETVIVSNKGFVLEALDPEKMELTTGRLIHHAIVGLPPEFLDTDLGGQFRGRRVTTIVQGSRGFRPPTDVGRVIYAGASFIIFESDVDLARETKTGVDVDKALLGPVRWDRVGRHRALRFSVKSDEDVWTYFVAQLAPKIVVCATDRVYLQETLERVASPGNERAFPAMLAEWRSLNTKRPFWGMRHYDRSGELHGPPSALSDDKGAVGCSFSFDERRDRFDLTYISRSNNAPTVMRDVFQLAQGDRFLNDIQSHGIHIVRFVVASRNTKRDRENAGCAPSIWVILGELGHAIYL
jgi:hypothetical protein